MYAVKLLGGLVVFFILLAVCSALVARDDPPSVQETPSAQVPTRAPVPTRAQTPANDPVPSAVLRMGVEMGDCKGMIGGKEFVAMTELEYAVTLRADGCSEELIAESLVKFADDQAALRAWHDEQATQQVYYDSLTVADLADCQAAAQPSVCEARLTVLYVEVSRTMREELPVNEQLTLERHLAQVREIDEVVEVQGGDFELTMAEIQFTCALLPQWAADIEAAQEYIASLGRLGLLGLEVELHQKQVYVTGMQEVCAASTGAPLGGVEAVVRGIRGHCPRSCPRCRLTMTPLFPRGC